MFTLAGIYAAIRDHPVVGPRSTPWQTMGSRRFGGETFQRRIVFQTDPDGPPTIVEVAYGSGGLFDVTVSTTAGKEVFKSVSASLQDPATLESVLNGVTLRTTIVSQRPSPVPPMGGAVSSATAERLHVFQAGQKSTVLLPAPRWLQDKGEDVLKAAKGGIRAPMPSLVVEVRVKPGDKVERGQAIVILESMKTETVLRTSSPGVVKHVACKKGEMVDEGKELVEIEIEE